MNENNVNDETPVRAEIVDDVHVVNSGIGNAHTTNTAVTLAEPSAFVALILAILSWCVLPIVGAIAALAIAPRAKRKIRASNGMLGGKKLAIAAQIIATLNLIAAVAVIYGFIALIRWIF